MTTSNNRVRHDTFRIALQPEKGSRESSAPDPSQSPSSAGWGPPHFTPRQGWLLFATIAVILAMFWAAVALLIVGAL